MFRLELGHLVRNCITSFDGALGKTCQVEGLDLCTGKGFCFDIIEFFWVLYSRFWSLDFTSKIKCFFFECVCLCLCRLVYCSLSMSLSRLSHLPTTSAMSSLFCKPMSEFHTLNLNLKMTPHEHIKFYPILSNVKNLDQTIILFKQKLKEYRIISYSIVESL